MLLVELLLIFVLALWGIKPLKKRFYADYLSKDKTNSIKGLFILLIVLTHSLPYIERSGYQFVRMDDKIFLSSLYHIGQLVVVMFLFYSGYGVSESFKKKGMNYAKSMPRHRILSTLLNFDVAVIFFIILSLILGITLTVKQSLLALTAWESVGNSNWYIFIILLCYIASYISFLLYENNKMRRTLLLIVIIFVFLILLSCFKEEYWYNTILCYPAGVLYSTFKEELEQKIKTHYILMLFISVLSFIVLFIIPFDILCIRYNVMCIAFAFSIVLFTMKTSIDNKCLRWFGKNLFPIYIYMRLPMIVMEERFQSTILSYPYIFILISLIITIGIARLYGFWRIKL